MNKLIGPVWYLTGLANAPPNFTVPKSCPHETYMGFDQTCYVADSHVANMKLILGELMHKV